MATKVLPIRWALGLLLCVFALGHAPTSEAAIELPAWAQECLMGLRGTPPTPFDPSVYETEKTTVTMMTRESRGGSSTGAPRGYVRDNLGAATYEGRKCTKFRLTDKVAATAAARPYPQGEGRRDAPTPAPNVAYVYTAREGDRVYRYDEATRVWTYSVRPVVQDGARWTHTSSFRADDDKPIFPVDPAEQRRWVWVGNFTHPITNREYTNCVLEMAATPKRVTIWVFAPDVGMIYSVVTDKSQATESRVETWAEHP